ncbi:MAG: hypothetical protein ACLU9S_05165 [Oscillospiraceae bacterium]
MKWGYNWGLGPFETWDVIGVERSVQRMRDEGAAIPRWIEERLGRGETSFYNIDPLDRRLSAQYPTVKEYGDSALLDLDDGVLCLEIRTKGKCHQRVLLWSICWTRWTWWNRPRRIVPWCWPMRERTSSRERT